MHYEYMRLYIYKNTFPICLISIGGCLVINNCLQTYTGHYDWTT